MIDTSIPTSEPKTSPTISATLSKASSHEELTIRKRFPNEWEKKRTYMTKAMSCVQLITSGVHLESYLLYSAIMMPADVMSEFPPEKCRTIQVLTAT